MSGFLFGCGDVWGDFGDCPPAEEHSIASGTFALTDGPYRTESDKFPASRASNLHVNVDRDASRVTVTYKVDGKTVVETYKISARELGY